MAKSRRRDRAKDLTNPIAKPIKPSSDLELAAIREKQILPIISDLISPELKKRSLAAAAVANLVEDTRCRKLLLREQIVRILLEQTITDSALESRSAGWCIMRNLAVEEEADFCIHLYRQDVLTAIQATAHNILATIESQEQPVAKLPKIQQSLVWTISTSAISLVSSLAEAQDEILEAISNIPIIIRFIFGLLSSDSIPEDLFIDVLSCLATLTEDNENLSKQIIDHDTWLRGLLQLREVGGAKAVAACGPLHNIFSAMQWFDHNTPIDGVSDAILIPALTQHVLEARTKSKLWNSSSHSTPDQILQLALEITASIATSLQEALEHANHNENEFEGFGNDEIGDDVMIDGDLSDLGVQEKEEGAQDSREMNEAEIDADMDLVTGFDVPEDEVLIDNQQTLNALIRNAAPAILSIIKVSGSNEAVRSSAISALNNVAWTASSIDFAATPSNLSITWMNLTQHIWSEVISPVLISNTADITLASSVTGLAWALARSTQGKLNLQADEQRKFMALYQASKILSSTAKNASNGVQVREVVENNDAFQGLGVKCIGVLGRLALDPAPITLNREIGSFLITVLSALPETPAADAIEALNQIFDIYADKGYACDEAVFWSDGFYRHLEAIQPTVRKMAKTIDKRKYIELRNRADEVVLNLGRFLVYKRKERARS